MKIVRHNEEEVAEMNKSTRLNEIKSRDFE